MTSVAFYCTGLMLLMFVPHPVMLPVAIVVFICGEVLMTPCFDETAKKHSGDAAMGTCMGLLHLASTSPADHAEFHRVVGRPGGGAWAAGDRLVQPDLAKTLQCLADLGPKAMPTPFGSRNPIPTSA